MLDLHSRSTWLLLTLLPLSLACASTSLPVPPNGAANPDAESMPLSSETRALQADYDPWSTEPAAAAPKASVSAGSGHEGHEGHRHD